jgi:predicted aspartyl protease
VPVHTSGDQLLADVGIGGVQLTLLVDTGATHTSLEAGALQRIAGERLHSAVSVRTAAGVVDLPLYRVADVTLGALEVPTLDVLELDADLPGVEGLLGMDLLRRVGLPRLKPGEERDPGGVPP